MSIIGGRKLLGLLVEFTDFHSSSAACCTLQQLPAQVEPHCRQVVPRSAHIGKWGVPRLEHLLVVGLVRQAILRHAAFTVQ